MGHRSLVTATFVAIVVALPINVQAKSPKAKPVDTPAKRATSEFLAGEARDNPVILVHGLNPIGSAGYPCPLTWDTMQDALRDWGWNTQPIDGVKYYTLDTFCEGEIDHHGSHNTHFGNNKWWTFGFNHSWLNTNSHSADTPIEHLGYHLAWYTYDHYTSQGKTVDLVGHSMGGLIIRYMLTMREQHNVDFPFELRVGDVITLETPHAGDPLTFFCGWSKQCQEMLPGSSFLESLGDNPQGTDGTDWTASGAYCDPLVGEESSVSMGAAHRLKYSFPCYEHLFPLYDTSESLNADFDNSENGGQWTQEFNGPHSVKEVDLALSSGDN